MKKKSTVNNDGVEYNGARGAKKNALTVDDKSVGCDNAMKKESIVDDNGIGSTGFGRTSLEKIDLSLYRKGRGIGCDGAIEKELIVDNSVGFTCLERSDLGRITSSLRLEERPQCC